MSPRGDHNHGQQRRRFSSVSSGTDVVGEGTVTNGGPYGGERSASSIHGPLTQHHPLSPSNVTASLGPWPSSAPVRNISLASSSISSSPPRSTSRRVRSLPLALVLVPLTLAQWHLFQQAIRDPSSSASSFSSTSSPQYAEDVGLLRRDDDDGLRRIPQPPHSNDFGNVLLLPPHSPRSPPTALRRNLEVTSESTKKVTTTTTTTTTPSILITTNITDDRGPAEPTTSRASHDGEGHDPPTIDPPRVSPQFPVWGDPRGISVQYQVVHFAHLALLHQATTNHDTHARVIRPANHSNEVKEETEESNKNEHIRHHAPPPGTGHSSSTSTSFHQTPPEFSEILYVVDAQGVWVSHTLRKRTIAKQHSYRLHPTESIMKLAHLILQQSRRHPTTTTDDGGNASSLPLVVPTLHRRVPGRPPTRHRRQRKQRDATLNVTYCRHQHSSTSIFKSWIQPSSAWDRPKHPHHNHSQSLAASDISTLLALVTTTTPPLGPSAADEEVPVAVVPRVVLNGTNHRFPAALMTTRILPGAAADPTLPPLHERWPLLRQAIYQGHGVPMLLWYGDYRQCPSTWSYTTTTTTTSVAGDDMDDDVNTDTFANATGTTDSILTSSTLPADPRFRRAPLFTTCAPVDCQFALPLPTYKTIRDSLAHAEDWDVLFRLYDATYPWAAKRPQLVWRGSLTGAHVPPPAAPNPRWQLGQIVTEHASTGLFDVGLVSIPKRHNHLDLNLTEVGGLKHSLRPMHRFMEFQAILDMDGNSWSSRFGSLLCYNSVVLKVEPHFVDYFHFRDLLPHVHFVPVRYDLSDLVAQTAWALDPTNHEAVQNIIRNANAWCRQRMTWPSLAQDVLDVWEQYVSYLQRDDPDWATRGSGGDPDESHALDNSIEFPRSNATTSPLSLASEVSAPRHLSSETPPVYLSSATASAPWWSWAAAKREIFRRPAHRQLSFHMVKVNQTFPC